MSFKKSLVLWIISIVFMTIVFIYQRATGPTYEAKGTLNIHGKAITFRLPRSHTTGHDSLISIKTHDPEIRGMVYFKRYKSYDTLSFKEMVYDNGKLKTWLPDQPFAGKVEYRIELFDHANKSYPLTDELIITRFKGFVPNYILYPHIFCMILAMIFSLRTGLGALYKSPSTYKYTLFTLVFLFGGGLILGPIVQKFAFDAYWTGWPFGHDLTDNKTIVSFVLWLVTFFVLRKNRDNRFWPIFAATMLLAVYLIPHSAMGSEIDHTVLEPNK